MLIIRCKDQTTEAAFSTKYNWLGVRSVDVTLRIDDEKLFKAVWKASIDGLPVLPLDQVMAKEKVRGGDLSALSKTITAQAPPPWIITLII